MQNMAHSSQNWEIESGGQQTSESVWGMFDFWSPCEKGD